MSTRTRAWTVAAAVAVVLLALPQAALAGPTDKQPVVDFESGEQITGAFTKLDRTADGVASKIRTSVAAGHAFTVWYVIFNESSACSDGMCGEDDIFTESGDFNVPQIEATRLSVVWGSSGGVSNSAGRISLDGGLAVGEVPGGAGQVLIGKAEDGAIVGLGVTTGLEAPDAEIHLVIQDHGVAHEDPALLAQQTSSFMGACNPDCVDVQFSVHK
jgi:hypothetical protein